MRLVLWFVKWIFAGILRTPNSSHVVSSVICTGYGRCFFIWAPNLGSAHAPPKGCYTEWEYLSVTLGEVMARVLIIDDHDVVRMGIRIALERAGYEVIGETGCGVDAVALAKSLLPDVVILDVDLPRIDGFGILSRMFAAGVNAKVIVFTGLPKEQYAVRCMRAGASGFISKEENILNLPGAVKMVLDGYSLFPNIAEHGGLAAGSSEPEVLEELSSRELAVLRYLARGYRIKEIAHEMLLSEKTVSTYKARLKLKLKVDSTLGLIDFARRNRAD